MKMFMTEDFLLSTDTARELYHKYAEKMPIIDFHCHINPGEIANDRKYPNITRLWLGGDHFGDHYKWRLIRADGADENTVTGDVPDRDRFEAFARMLPKAIGNPMYHWTHLELKRYFGYDGILGPDTAQEVWELCNEKLRTLSVRELIYMSNVEVIATTDDPLDNLESHKAIGADPSCRVKVVPSWRPDKVMNLEKPGYRDYIGVLSNVSGVNIHSVSSLEGALAARMDYFDAHGCRASDHGLDYIPYAERGGADLDDIFSRALAGVSVSLEEITKFKFHILRFLGREYRRRNWVMQLHYGAVRNVNTKRLTDLGPDTGYDCIGNAGNPSAIARFLDALDTADALPKTVLYSANDCDDNMLVSLMACFQGSDTIGKLQHGSAWWFNDTKSGMVRQLTTLAEGGLLGNFIGMLTDSRSFLSYTRHEYFRRILCDLIGDWVENGEYPYDMDILSEMVKNISYYNCKHYFSY